MLTRARASTRNLSLCPKNYQIGNDAAYRDLSGGWGYKLFRCPEQRNANFALQTKAHAAGLAPAVKDCYTEPGSDGMEAYGFLTQSVPMTEQERFYGRKYVTVFVWRDYAEWKAENTGILKCLREELANIDISAYDMSWDNVGMLGGKLVCIDFSCECVLPHTTLG